ncbi:60 kDa chaperonin [candidate division SR1 bacterium Aalborg_AAW-1]|nr:60 kDa chaperonin [candidate division SR1 bacterium Aalborg_AAW-1]
MSAKIIKYGDDARKEIFQGMEQVAKTVMVTMGPKGKNVLLSKSFGAPVPTNDGVTVAKEIEFEDQYHNTGAAIVKEAADKTNKQAGDGTTTTTTLLYGIANEGQRYIRAGVNPFALSKGLHKGVAKIIEELQTKATPVSNKEEIKQVASISAQDEEVGQLIADIIDEVGKDGVISVEEGKSMGLTKEVVIGMQFDQGYGSPYFVSDPQRMEAVIENASLLITDKKISSLKDIINVLESLAATGRKNIVIIADDVEGEALTSLVLNKMRGAINVLTVKAPGFGDRKKEILKDIAAVTGATVITEELGLKLEEATLDMLGAADKVISSKDKTTIVGGKGELSDIDARVNDINAQFERSSSDYDKEKLAERKARLVGGVAVIKVGAATEMEMKNKKYKIEDALNATRAAVEEGIVPGGGVTLANIAKSLEHFNLEDADEHIGIEILKEAIQYPVKKIADNAGYKGDWVVEAIKAQDEFNFGFDAKTGEFKNMLQAGIIDPAKVLRVSLENAVSAAAMFLTTDAIIVDAPKKDEPMAGAGMGGMGGMGGMDMY